MLSNLIRKNPDGRVTEIIQYSNVENITGTRFYIALSYLKITSRDPHNRSAVIARLQQKLARLLTTLNLWHGTDKTGIRIPILFLLGPCK